MAGENDDFWTISDTIKQRAVELASSPGMALRHATPDMQKKLLATMDEVEKLWRQGKPVQRRSQTVLSPMLWHVQTGIAPEDLDMGTATDLIDLMRPGNTKQWKQLIDVAANALLGQLQMYGHRMSGQQFFAAIQLPFTALFIYMSARRFGAPSVFELRDSLAEKLILTDADSVRPRDVRPPLPGFYIQMPPGALEMWNSVTGWHKVSLVGVAEGRANDGPREGRLLLSLFWGEPNEKSTSATDDNAQVNFVSLPEGFDGSIEEYEATIDDDGMDSRRERRPFVRWQGVEFAYEDGYKLLRKFVVNFCLYLSSPNPDIQPTGGRQTWPEVVEKAEHARRAGSGARRQVTIGKNFSLWDVGRQVTRIQRTLTKDDILVRGHFRQQAHGPGRALRKVIWIEPFVRRPTGGDVEGHDYAVKGVRENGRVHDIAREIARRISPFVGASLGSDVANNAATVYGGDDDDEEKVPVVVAVRDALMQRKRYPGVYKAEHLTDEMIDKALTAVEDMEA
jgi:hypothetical protein